MTFQSRRSAIYGRSGMVAASQPLAVAAGLQTLQAGGNAVDAAVAVSAALNVTEPTSTGLGGDTFALFYEAPVNRSSRSTAPGAPRPPDPGAPADRKAWEWGSPGSSLHRHRARRVCGLVRPGRALWPASVISQPGPGHPPGGRRFPVAPVTAYFWQRSAEHHPGRAFNGQELTLEGRGPAAGRDFSQPRAGDAACAPGRRRQGSLLPGAIAEAIVGDLAEAGGCMALEDLAAHTSTWEEPSPRPYRGLRV